MNEVTNFMLYIYNRWSQSEAVRVFGDNLGLHIWNKWINSREKGIDTLYWYSELDSDCRDKIVYRANEVYGDCL